MKEQTKIQLLPFEIELLSDGSIILTKNAILQKLKIFLEEFQLKQKAIIEKNISLFPAEVLKTSPKVSRGENYKGLPWLVLDYPRHFEFGNIFAIRTMFWWGNFFSITLHLSGKYKEAYQHKITVNLPAARQDLFICIHENQWQHHFEAGNYIPVKQMPHESLMDMVYKKQFIKLAIKFPLQPWAALPALLENAFVEMIELLKD